MRDTTTALYQGKEYDASIKEDGKITLISDDSDDINKGFVLYKGIKYIKRVERKELDKLYKKNIKTIYKGYDCAVLEEDGDKILIMIDNILHTTSIQLEMDKAIDKGIYEKWISKDDVKLTVQKEIL